MSIASPAPIAPWHNRLLAAAAVFTVLLIAMGGILDVTQSIRSCPDWPGCFGKILPPLETSPILEVTHRLLAGTSGLLIFSAAIAALLRARRARWVVLPMLLASVLVVVVSYLGMLTVLRGISKGWALVDLGSALLVVALCVSAAVMAAARERLDERRARFSLRGSFARLALAAVIVVYVVLVSGVLVAGQGSITTTLGWPIYSPQVIQADSLGAANLFRLLLSGAGVGLIILVLIRARRMREESPAVFRRARWVAAVFLFEVITQGLMLAFGVQTPLRLAYTVGTAVFWGLLVALAVEAAMEPAPGKPKSP